MSPTPPLGLGCNRGWGFRVDNYGVSLLYEFAISNDNNIMMSLLNKVDV